MNTWRAANLEKSRLQKIMSEHRRRARARSPPRTLSRKKTGKPHLPLKALPLVQNTIHRQTAANPRPRHPSIQGWRQYAGQQLLRLPAMQYQKTSYFTKSNYWATDITVNRLFPFLYILVLLVVLEAFHMLHTLIPRRRPNVKTNHVLAQPHVSTSSDACVIPSERISPASVVSAFIQILGNILLAASIRARAAPRPWLGMTSTGKPA